VRTVAVTEAVTLGRAGAAARLLAHTAAQQGSRVLLATNDPRVADGEHEHGLRVERFPIEAGDAARSWLSARRDAFDLVLIDLPSPVGSAAALEFASLADQVLAVWVADSITRQQLARLGRTLRRADIPLAGVVRVGGQAA
jgi:predicted membrane-bound spermidine synthase